MHIEKLSVKDREVTVSLSADEIVKLCNSLHYTPEKQQNDIYHKLYSDLLLMRDICQYGRIDNWGLAKVEALEISTNIFVDLKSKH